MLHANQTTDGSPHSARGVATAYAAVAALWIVGSDWALSHLGLDPAAHEIAQTVKGWLFVAVTSAFLYGALRRRQVSGEAARQREMTALRDKAHAAALLQALVDT